MADQKKGDAGKGGGAGGGKPKGYRAQRGAEGGENSGFDRALQPDLLSEGVTCLVGLVGQSTREGYHVLFLELDMNSRVEIRDEDIVYSEKLSPEESPFGSLGGTRICVKKGAELDYSRTTARKVQAEALAGDEFDLDIRLGQRGTLRGGGQPERTLQPLATGLTICGDTCRFMCAHPIGEPIEAGPTFGNDTCWRSCGDTCFNTCANTCHNTCDYTCVNKTCVNTCLGTCGGTCDTCPRTACGLTCDACITGGIRCGTWPRTRCNC